jgi:hypothetical protein
MATGPEVPDSIPNLVERCPLSLVSTIEELLGIERSGSDLESWKMAVGIHHADHLAPSIRKCWH